jgi:hypothetical protein
MSCQGKLNGSLKKNLLIVSVAIVVLTAYLLPFSYSDGFESSFGYPFSYITIYNIQEPIKENETLLMRSSTNPIIFSIDVGLIYLSLNVISTLKNRIKKK